MLKVLIVDDEPLARQRIRRLLDHWKESLEIVGECRSGTEALPAIRQARPDILFLDIQMKDMTGFELLELYKQDNATALPLVIFVTAYDQYALRAFDFFALDYLLKPYREERFHQSVQRALDNHRQRQQEQGAGLDKLLEYVRDAGAGLPTSIAFRTGSAIRMVEPDQIRYIEGAGYYAEIHTGERKLLVREPLKDLLQRLPMQTFLRIHRSTIINLNHLEEVIPLGNGETEVRMRDGKQLRVSRTYREELYRRVGVG